MMRDLPVDWHLPASTTGLTRWPRGGVVRCRGADARPHHHRDHDRNLGAGMRLQSLRCTTRAGAVPIVRTRRWAGTYAHSRAPGTACCPRQPMPTCFSGSPLRRPGLEPSLVREQPGGSDACGGPLSPPLPPNWAHPRLPCTRAAPWATEGGRGRDLLTLTRQSGDRAELERRYRPS